jgi:hypothetical protein
MDRKSTVFIIFVLLFAVFLILISEYVSNRSGGIHPVPILPPPPIPHPPRHHLIGGCAGTRWGCCSDGVTSKNGPWDPC